MLIMQTANDAMSLNQYLICCLLVLIPSYVLAAGSLRLWDSPTILAQYWGFYLVLHAVFMLLALVAGCFARCGYGYFSYLPIHPVINGHCS